MKNPRNKRSEESSMPPANFVAILALVTEMAKRLNKNISKVQLGPLDSTLATVASPSPAENSKA